MYRKIADFLNAWETESKATQKVLDAISDGSLQQRVFDGHRTLGRIAWHIVTTIPEMMVNTGLELDIRGAGCSRPRQGCRNSKGLCCGCGRALEAGQGQVDGPDADNRRRDVRREMAARTKRPGPDRPSDASQRTIDGADAAGRAESAGCLRAIERRMGGIRRSAAGNLRMQVATNSTNLTSAIRGIRGVQECTGYATRISGGGLLLFPTIR